MNHLPPRPRMLVWVRRSKDNYHRVFLKVMEPIEKIICHRKLVLKNFYRMLSSNNKIKKKTHQLDKKLKSRSTIAKSVKK